MFDFAAEKCLIFLIVKYAKKEIEIIMWGIYVYPKLPLKIIPINARSATMSTEWVN